LKTASFESRPTPSRLGLVALFALCVGATVASCAQNATVTGQVELLGENSAQARKNKSNVVVWLNPLDPGADVRPASQSEAARHPRLTQRDKRFDPHILVVPVGSVVEFPNHDPFFHNVFSLFEGKRFDLGLYEAGTTRLVHFDRLGVSYIFCNTPQEDFRLLTFLPDAIRCKYGPKGQVSITSTHSPARWRSQTGSIRLELCA
jgi:plastocyanin